MVFWKHISKGKEERERRDLLPDYKEMENIQSNNNNNNKNKISRKGTVGHLSEKSSNCVEYSVETPIPGSRSQ